MHICMLSHNKTMRNFLGASWFEKIILEKMVSFTILVDGPERVLHLLDINYHHVAKYTYPRRPLSSAEARILLMQFIKKCANFQLIYSGR